MKHFFLLFICASLFIGCTTDMKRQFDQVKIGMEKNDVLGIMDSPQRTQRWHGMDRWTYIFYSDDMRQEKEVHFQDGHANYVGNVFKPEVSAEDQDHRNEIANAEVEKSVKVRHEQIRSSLSNDMNPAPPGRNAYVPQFEPVQ